MFFYKKKIWLLAIISLFSSLVLASISELIQWSIPGRGGTFKDVLIDFAGATVGFSIIAVVYLIVFLVKKQKKKANLTNK